MMGLDQCAIAVQPHLESSDFEIAIPGGDSGDFSAYAEVFHKWRKHPDLHGLMEVIFNRKADAAGFQGEMPSGVFRVTATPVFPELNHVFSAMVRDIGQEAIDALISAATREVGFENYMDGTKRCFNGQSLRLTAHDLDEIEVAVRAKQLPHTTGFFFGESTGDEMNDDLQFINEARLLLLKGFDIYYFCDW
jgi:hypothetical protein